MDVTLGEVICHFFSVALNECCLNWDVEWHLTVERLSLMSLRMAVTGTVHSILDKSYGHTWLPKKTSL